jgi:hypothetical protein
MILNFSGDGIGAAMAPMKTHVIVEQALEILIEDYKASKDPITYGELAGQCGYEPTLNSRVFGQVIDMIDAACALAGIPSFALLRVRQRGGKINGKAWRGEYSQLRERIINRAKSAKWSDEDFTKIRNGPALFSSKRLGNKRAWKYVRNEINMNEWAGS